ncbi:MAG: AAA family ATPase, partial [Bacteroidota bacterium]
TEKKETYIEGNRNNFIHLLACNCNRFGLKEQKTLSLILENYKGLPEQEIKNTVHSAFNNTSEYGTFDYVDTKTDETVTFSKPVSTLYASLLESIAYYDKMPEPKYIWGAIVEGSFGYIFGSPGVGKTIFCENIGLCLASGSSTYLGQEIENSRKRSVLFIAMEEYGKFSRKRNKRQIEKMNLTEGEEFIYNVSTEEFPDYFGNDKDWEKLEKVIADSKAEVVIIDSMTRATDGQIEDSSIGRAISIRLRSIAQKFNVTLIVIHHSIKLNGNKITLDSLAGSRVIAQKADFVYGVNMVDNVRYLKEIKSRYKQLKEKVTTFKINDNAWLEKVNEVHEDYLVSVPDNRENPANDQIIIETVQQKISVDEPKVETKMVQEAVLDNIKKTEFYRRLKKLSKMGKLNWDSPYISLP